MSEKLTDERLAELTRIAETHERVTYGSEKTVLPLLAELRARRAVDLTADERDALAHAREFVAEDRLGHCDEVGCANSVCMRNDAALAVLDRLIASHDAERAGREG